MIKILCRTPNIHTLALKSILFYGRSKDYIEQSEELRLVPSTNTITNVSSGAECTLERIELLFALYPQTQRLTVNPRPDALETIL